VDNGWVIGKEFGHVAHGYVVTSHASQGKTVDKVLIGQSSLSLPASGREQFYVSVSRGREQALVFTDDKEALVGAVGRGTEKLTAREVFRRPTPVGRERLNRHLAFLRRQGQLPQPHAAAAGAPPREIHYER
jgi:ATP-dependent exoDNAse (exonuclease V) alpha subunit